MTAAAVLYLTSPFGDAGSMAGASTLEVLWMLAIIAVEMSEEAIDHGLAAERTGLAVAGFVATFAVTYAISAWRQRTMTNTERTGLTVAYLVVVALGLHSIGEGLAIGVAFVQGGGRSSPCWSSASWCTTSWRGRRSSLQSPATPTFSCFDTSP